MRYMAKKDGYATLLSKDSQFDEFLAKDCEIYSIDDNDNEVLIATPKDGFLRERPTLEQVQQSSNAELESLRSDVDFITMMTGVDL